MKILQINKFFYIKGGSDTYFFSLSDLLSQNGHEVAFFSMKDPKNRSSSFSEYFVDNIDFSKREGLKEFKKAAHSFYSLEAKRKLEKLIKKYRPDIAHLHNIAHHLSPSILSVLKKHNIPIVQTLHDYQLICPNYKLYTEGEVCERCKKYKYFETVIHKCLQDAYLPSAFEALEMYFHKSLQIYENMIDYYVSPSEFLAEKLVAWGHDKRKIAVINNFINSKNFKPNFKNGNYILYFGRLAEEKGLKILVQAMKEANDINLKIAGEGPLKPKLEKYARENKLSNIEFLGFKNQEELSGLISDSAFTVMPSVWYENYPYGILESFAFGKPVVASDLGGISELIIKGKTGFSCRPGEPGDLAQKIKKLYSDKDLILKMGKAARKFVEENNSPETHYKQIIALYNNLLADYGKKSEQNKSRKK